MTKDTSTNTPIPSENPPKPLKKTKPRDFDNIPRPARPSVSVGGKTLYLTNKELLAEVKRCKANNKMSNELAAMLQLLCSRYGKKGSFVNYSYNEDMQAYAMYMLVKTWHKFNDELYFNAFAFYTQCVKHSFKQYLNMEKKHRTIRDLLLIDSGLNPSFNFSDDRSEYYDNYEGDYDSFLSEPDLFNEGSDEVDPLKTTDIEAVGDDVESIIADAVDSNEEDV